MDKLEVVGWRWTDRDRTFGNRSIASTVKPIEHEWVIDLQPRTPQAPAQAEIDRLLKRIAELEAAIRGCEELSALGLNGNQLAIDVAKDMAKEWEKEKARALAAEAEIDRLRGEVERLRIHLKRSGANLAAAISLLRAAFNQKKPPNMVVSSDKMFGEMLSGYETVLDVVRATLKDTPMTDLTEIKRPTKDTYD